MKYLTTKEKIIYEALTLFSIKGYESVSVRDISRSVGIKESSLYNHFKNKQDIFDTIISICEERANKMYSNLNIIDTFNGDFTFFEGIAQDQLLNITKASFEFYVVDNYMSKFRKVLTIEQYNNQRIGDLFRDMFIEQPVNFQTQLFSRLMDIGQLKKSDPKATAMEFYAPIFMLLYQYDSINEEVNEILQKHISNFSLKNSV